MALLRRLRDSAPIPLTCSVLAGRAAICAIRLDGKYASGEHAKFYFSGEGWILKDMGSRNGTYVSGRRLHSGGAVFLAPGARIGFGELEPTHEVWSVDPPGPMAQDLETNQIIAGESGMLAVSQDESPEAIVYPGPTGWLFERGTGEVRPVDDLEVVRIGARLYRLFLPLPDGATPVLTLAFTPRNTSFRFTIGGNDECVAIELLFRGTSIARLDSHAYGSLLLALARARLEDQSQPIEERGWRTVDELCDKTGVDEAALNVAVHRIRKRISATKMTGAPGIVEVRRGMRRLATDGLELVRLE